MRIRNNSLSPSAVRAFSRGANDYACYLAGLGTRSPRAAAGRDFHDEIAAALMGEEATARAARTITLSGVPLTPLGVEVDVSRKLDDRFSAHGRLDALFSDGHTLTVIDWKTGRPNDNWEQLSHYCFVVEGLGLAPVAGASAMFVDACTGKPRSKRDYPWSAQASEATRSRLIKTAEAITTTPPPKYLLLPVRGVTMRPDYPENVTRCRAGDRVELDHTTFNDEPAIEIVHGETAIGWVPAELAGIIDAKTAKIAAVFEPTPTKNGGLRIAVRTAEVACDF